MESFWSRKWQQNADWRAHSLWNLQFAPTYFQPQGCPVIGQVRPQVRGRTYLQLTWVLFVFRLPPGQQRIQRVRSLKFSHSKYASYIGCFRTNPQLVPFKKTFWTKEVVKYGAYRKRSSANYLIGHFRVPKTLTFKMRLGAQPTLWKWVYLEPKKKFYVSPSNFSNVWIFWGWGRLRLQRLRGSRMWTLNYLTMVYDRMRITRRKVKLLLGNNHELLW